MLRMPYGRRPYRPVDKVVCGAWLPMLPICCRVLGGRSTLAVTEAHAQALASPAVTKTLEQLRASGASSIDICWFLCLHQWCSAVHVQYAGILAERLLAGK